MITKFGLTLDDAKQVVRAAVAQAAVENWAIIVAVVDDGGHLIYLERGDGAPVGAVASAIEKAKTALLFRRPSKIMQDAVNSGFVALMALPGATPIEGGLPLAHDGAIVGAIGVAGLSADEDGIIAAAGAAASLSLPTQH